MQLEVANEKGHAVVRLDARKLDAAAAIRFKDRFREIAEDSCQHYILDMSLVSFMDSSGLGAVVAVMKHLGPDRKLDIAGLTPAVDKVFKLTRMDKIFDIFPTLAEALDAACGPEPTRQTWA